MIVSVLLVFITACAAALGNAPSGDTVYITKSGEKYHAQDCPTIDGNGIPVLLETAKEHDYDACEWCIGED